MYSTSLFLRDGNECGTMVFEEKCASLTVNAAGLSMGCVVVSDAGKQVAGVVEVKLGTYGWECWMVPWKCCDQCCSQSVEISCVLCVS
eukprot:5995713-Amphidinium_carterae.1